MSALIALIALMVTYLIVLTITTLAAQPFRLRLVVLVDEILEEKSWNREERDILEFMGRSCADSSAGVLLPFAAMYSVAAKLLGGRRDDDNDLERLEKDARHKKVVALYFISIAGGSPFAAMVALPFIILSGVIGSFRDGGSFSDAVDAPIRQVSHSFHTC
jgi:hypothetical protein